MYMLLPLEVHVSDTMVNLVLLYSTVDQLFAH
jgi:hypothetical protein